MGGFLTAVASAPTGVSPDVKAATEPLITSARSSVGTTRLDVAGTVGGLLTVLQGLSDERRSARRAASSSPHRSMTRSLEEQTRWRRAAPGYL